MPLAPLNPDGYIIRVSETALMQMCLSGLEAYSVSHRGNKGHKTGLETYGHLFGHETALPDDRTLYCIDFLDIDTSAERTRFTCTPNPESLTLKRDILTSFFPQYEFMGNFHTHPAIGTRSQILNCGFHRFSPTDFAFIQDSPEVWIHHNFRVGLVLTISIIVKRPKKHRRVIDANTIEFILGNYRFFLKGYVAALDEDEEDIILIDDVDSVSLHCPSLLGVNRESTPFGKGKNTSKLRHVCGII